MRALNKVAPITSVHLARGFLIMAQNDQEKPSPVDSGIGHLASGDYLDAESFVSLALSESSRMLSSKFLAAGNLAKFLEAKFGRIDWTFSHDLDFENITLEIGEKLLPSLNTKEGANLLGTFIRSGGTIQPIDPMEGYIPPGFVSEALGFQLCRKALVNKVLQAELSKPLSLRLVGALAFHLAAPMPSVGWGLRDLAWGVPDDLVQMCNQLAEEDLLLIILRFVEELNDVR